MDSRIKLDKCVNLLNNILDEKCLKHLKKLDDSVTQNLLQAKIKTRPAKANGLWCFTLLPTVVITYSLLYGVSPVYKLAACMATGLLFYNVLFHIFMSVTSQVFTTGAGAGCLVAGLVTSLMVYYTIKEDTLFVLCLALPSPFMFNSLVHKLLLYPKTFTIGEVVIVAQSIVIGIVLLAAQTFSNLGDNVTGMDYLVNGVVITALSTAGFIVTALNMLNEDARTIKMLSFVLAAATVFAVIQLYALLGITCIPRIFYFLFLDSTRVKLLSFWLFLLMLAVLFLIWGTKVGVKASTSMRKPFHFLAALVFASGILLDLRLMEMATGIGFALLVIVEGLRKSDIEEISPALQSVFDVYSDDKDCGLFAVTPLYMYCGLAFGLVAPRQAAALERLAGVLAVGVGDAAASWFGKRYGRRKWQGQNRTVEGTLFNILSQIMTVFWLGIFELLNCKNALFRTAVAATVSGLVEAKTEQVDNLVLPLVNLIAFQLTYFMS